MKLLLVIVLSTACRLCISENTLDAGGNATSPTPNPLPPAPIPKPPPLPPPPPADDPVTDAMVYESKVSAQSATEYQRFGHSIAAFGSSVAVGSSKESTTPSVYLYSVQVSSGSVSSKASHYAGDDSPQYSHSQYVNVTWTEEQEYFAPSDSGASYYDGYGQTVAMGTQGLVVGAPYSNVAAAASSSAPAYTGYSVGVAHVFSSASQDVQTLTPSTLYANMQFASALSMQNATLAVGAPGASETGQMSGAVYVFQYDSETSEWVEEAELMDDEGGAAFAKFGGSVCLSSEATALAVGVSGYSKNVIHGGAVFLYQRVVQQAQANATYTGQSVAHRIATALFGNITDGGNSTAPSQQPSAQPTAQPTEQQAAEQTKYVWALHSVLVPSGLSAYAYFGNTVAFRDKIGLVSAYDEAGSGVVYLYEPLESPAVENSRTPAGLLRGFASGYTTNAATSWVLTSILTPTSPSPVNRFGASLAIFHTSDAYSRYTDETGTVELDEAYVLAIGAPGDSAGGANASAGSSASVNYAGAVYLYLGPRGDDSQARRGVSLSPGACCKLQHSAATGTYSRQFDLMTKVLANDSTAYNNYGSSLALMGAHLLVGAELADTPTASRAGAVYIETNLIPYLVAATQQAEGSTDDDDGGNGSNDGDSGDNAAKTGWAAFLAFIGTSGGIVTMSFLPIAVLAILFVAHSRTKGKKIAFDFSRAASCCASAPPSSGRRDDASSTGAGAALTASSEEAATETTPAATNSIAAPALSTAAVHNVLQQQQPQSDPQASADVEQPQQALDTAEDTADSTTPSFWQRALHFLRNPGMLRYSAVRAEVPAEGFSASADATQQPRAPPNSPQDNASTPPGKDLRLRSATVTEMMPSTQELSIRSPITHIPLHSSLVQSPHGTNAQSQPVRSYRFSLASSGGRPSGEKENRAPGPAAELGRGEHSGLLAMQSDLQRLKEKLNAEFTTPPVSPGADAGPRSAVEPERASLLGAGPSSAPKPHTASISSGSNNTAGAGAAAAGDRRKGKVAATIRV